MSATNNGAKEHPQFVGGEEQLREFLSLNIHYPNEALRNKIEGEVIVRFKIDEEGNISEVTSLKNLGYGCDEEAIKVIKRMPKWIPAKRNGKKVAIIYHLPIVFELPKHTQDTSE